MSHFSLKKIQVFIKGHKLVSLLIAVSLFSAVYTTLKPKNTSNEVRYIEGRVKKGSIVVSVSGTGDVLAKSQIDLKSKTSMSPIVLSVSTGQWVYAGQVIASVSPADTNFIQAKQAVADAKTAEAKSYADSLGDISSTLSDLPAVVNGLHDMLYTTNGYLNDSNLVSLAQPAGQYRAAAGLSFDAANTSYQNLVNEYRRVSVLSGASEKMLLINDAYDAAQKIFQALKDAQTAIEYLRNLNSNNNLSTVAGNNAAASVSSWLSTTNGHLVAVLNDKTSVDSAPSTVRQKEAAYQDYFIVAPFSGLIGRLSVRDGDSVGSGSVVATLITKDKIATITLNEVDAVKVKKGDKVELTFDAIDGLTISGTVSQIDLVGTVTQGVVNYGAEISFDQDDARVLPSMSVNAAIVTEEKDGVLVIPSSAVKNNNQGRYVLELATSTQTKIVPIKTGLSNDTQTEVVSGLVEGEQIVVRTVIPSSATATPAAPSLFGGNNSTRGATRAVTR